MCVSAGLTALALLRVTSQQRVPEPLAPSETNGSLARRTFGAPRRPCRGAGLSPGPTRVGGGEKGYQFGGREGARCGVTLWPAVGAERGKKLTASSLRPDCPRL